MKWRKWSGSARIELAVILLFSLTPLLWFSGNQLLLGHDSGFRLNVTEHLKNLTSSWNPNINYGSDWSLYFGFLPIQFIETAASAIGSSLAIGQRITFVYWFLAIGLSMWLFVRHFFEEDEYTPLRIVAPVFYMINYYLLDAWTIAERAKFSLYIALPLVIVIIDKTLHKEWSVVHGAIAAGLLFTVMSGGGSPPLYGSVAVAGAVYVAYALFRSVRDQKKRLLLFCSGAVLLFLGMNAYWILPQVRLASGSYSSAVSGRGGIDGLIAWEHEVSKYASLPNVLRLQGFSSWYDNPEHPYANILLTNPIMIAISWIPILTVFSGMAVFGLRSGSKKQRDLLAYLCMLLFVGIFFTMGSHSPTGKIYEYLMRHIPGFAVFRSSFYKFAPLVFFPVIVLSGFFISRLSMLFQLKKNHAMANILIPLTAISVLCVYHFPAFTGSLFGLKGGFTTRVSLPVYVQKMGSDIRSATASDDRILLLPPLDAGFINSPIDTYTWGFYSLDVLPRILVNRSIVANDSTDGGVTRQLYQYAGNGDEASFLRLARSLGITHVLWRGDVRLTQETARKKSVADWQAVIGSFPSLTLIADERPWSLYAVQYPVRPALFNSPRRIAYATPDTQDIGQIVIDGTNSYGQAIISVQNPDTVLYPADLTVSEMECFYCKEREFDRLVDAIRLPAYRPNRIPVLANRQLSIEKEAIARSVGTGKEIDAQLSVASTRLSSYLAAAQEEKNKTEYQTAVRRILAVLEQHLTGREKIQYANRISAFLTAHLRDSRGTALESFLNGVIGEIEPFGYRAQNGTYRFGFTVPAAGTYVMETPFSTAYAQSGLLDGKPEVFNAPIEMGGGFHTFEIPALDTTDTKDSIRSPVFVTQTSAKPQESSMPDISYTRMSAAAYRIHIRNAKKPFVLVFNERFDPGWKLTVDGEISAPKQVEANGYANAWFIPGTGSIEASLQYDPQRYFHYGLMITIASISFSILYLLFKKRTT